MGLQSGRLEGHCHGAPHMLGPIANEGAGKVGARPTLTIVGLVFSVCRIVRVRQLVIFALADTTGRDQEPARDLDPERMAEIEYWKNEYANPTIIQESKQTG